MKKTIKTLLAGMLAVPLLALGVTVFSPVPATTHAACDTSNLNIQSGADCAQGSSKTTCLFSNGSCTGIFTTIVNIMLYIIGAISVIMLIYGGIRYTISGGNTASVTAAKNTILYAIVGIIVAVLAYAIVNFVLNTLTQS